MHLRLGLDIGSISINSILSDQNGTILDERYTYCRGKPYQRLLELLKDLAGGFGISNGQASSLLVATTGSGGKTAADLLGGTFVNEVVALASAVSGFSGHGLKPGSVIEMGGEDAKLLFMEEKGHGIALSDFVMNTVCAAGTGSFLDQQAKRVGVSIDGEFGAMALKSQNPPRIAGRCSVFAKSDMIHLQQIATPVEDIVAGLCFAVARNFKSSMARGRNLQEPVLFLGGVSKNLGMVRAFRETLGLDDKSFVVPHHNTSFGAIGAIAEAAKTYSPGGFRGLRHLADYVAEGGAGGLQTHRAALVPANSVYDKTVHTPAASKDPLDVYLGLDIGSLSTNVVLIDEKNRVVARRYLPTASRPLDAIRRGLEEISAEVGDRVVVRAAGTTGSGRYLTGDFIGADAIRNEITAQATAAIAHDPSVDTIFEIGGQDSKYISIKDGVVVDFEMNKVCAAGTGSFLEEQAEKLGIDIKSEFSDLAFSSPAPAHLGDRCTVFMESDLNSTQQQGASTEGLVGGLAYSIVNNYLHKVVVDKPIGDRIFFQGGVTNNRAVVAAFQQVTGKTITVPPHFDVTGAIGAAMLARDELRRTGRSTRFKGFGIGSVPFSLDSFTCKACSNQCEIRRVRIEGETRPLFYGGRCEKYEVDERKGKGQDIANLFQERERFLLGDFEESAPAGRLTRDAAKESSSPEARAAVTDVRSAGSYGESKSEGVTTIGIPRGLMVYWQQFPYWRAFFEELGFRIVLSPPTDHHLVAASLEKISAETCFPVSLMTGHVHALFKAGVDYVFAPFVVNAPAEEGNPTVNYNCPWVQTYGYMVRASLEQDQKRRLLIPALHFRHKKEVLENDLTELMGSVFDCEAPAVVAAMASAEQAQFAFEEACARRGAEVLDDLPASKRAMVVLARPYNSGDPTLNLRLVEKLIRMDVLPLPVDFLPLSDTSIFPQYSMMCWPNGQRMLKAAKIVAKDPRLHAVHLSNFRCGPDSFISHYLREELRDKPFLQLEVDEHGADAGAITRIEAFLDSLKGREPASTAGPSINLALREEAATAGNGDADRTLYIPYMQDGAYILAAAARSCGLKAVTLPKQTEEDLELGRRHTSSRECFPMICTTGSFIKKALEPGFRPEKASFFMPDHNGPCRFGQYNKLQDIIFRRLGFEDITIVAPSNENSYAGFSNGRPLRFRLAAIRGVVASDLLRKFLQERRPYEVVRGSVDAVYQKALATVVEVVERGGAGIAKALRRIAEEFSSVEINKNKRKPIVAIVGEIFMRDNEFCSGNLVRRLEALGAETIIAPFREWITYSTYRWGRDAKWKGDTRAAIKARIQSFFQHLITKRISGSVADELEMERDIELEEMLELCDPYIHRDYDGDPALAFGAASALARQGISGVVNILPFTCMPGTVIAAGSPEFRKDHDNIPWLNIAYDGQNDVGIETRLQAFVHQAKEYRGTTAVDTQAPMTTSLTQGATAETVTPEPNTDLVKNRV